MKSLYIILMLRCLLSSVIGKAVVDNNQLQPGYCYSSLPNIGLMKVGEVKTTSTVCVRAICDEDLQIYYHSCPNLQLPPYCKLKQVKVDAMHQYPECCPYVECS